MASLRTETETINEQLDILHAKNADLASRRKYDEMAPILAQIQQLESYKLSVNKVSELMVMVARLKPMNEGHQNMYDLHVKRTIVAISEVLLELSQKIDTLPHYQNLKKGV